ncbi:hypothetical protein [Parablautia intestinalis]|nr:hypothetical protein [Parablautia intestinalis]
MNNLSTRSRNLAEALSIFEGVEVKFCTIGQVKEYGLAKCNTPKKGCEKNKPFIRICDEDTNIIYNMALQCDPNGTSCIMELINTKIKVTKENDAMLYSIFTLLHEAGHWYDYKDNPDEYTNELEAWNNSADSGISMEAAMAYRNRTMESRADQFALNHLWEAWIEIDTRIFKGLLGECAFGCSELG